MHLLMDRMDWVLLICAHPLLDLTSSVFFPYAYLLIHGFDNLGFVEPLNIINAGDAILVNDVLGVVNQAIYKVQDISGTASGQPSLLRGPFYFPNSLL